MAISVRIQVRHRSFVCIVFAPAECACSHVAAEKMLQPIELQMPYNWPMARSHVARQRPESLTTWAVRGSTQSAVGQERSYVPALQFAP